MSAAALGALDLTHLPILLVIGFVLFNFGSPIIKTLLSM